MNTLYCSAVFGGLRGGSFTYAQARIDRRIRDDLFRSLVRQEIGFFDANKTGKITFCWCCQFQYI